MRAPSTTAPDVVVIDDVDVDKKPKIVMNPKKDLWLSTVDGRHQSPIIPVRVGACADTFYVHRSMLAKAEYFRKALEGGFEEATNQAIDLPEEDPDVFSFVVAYLYENSYKPIKAVADVLIPESEKGKGRESQDGYSTSQSRELTDSETSGSDASTRRIRADRRRVRQSQLEEQERNRKEPGRHRPDCACPTCAAETRGPPCWNCGVPRTRNTAVHRPQFFHANGMQPPPPPPPQGPMYANGMHFPPYGPYGRGADVARRGPPIHTVPEPRMTEEDVGTWIMTYELSVDVYLCAERYLMTDFKECIGQSIINSFESAGVQAARPEVLASCRKLHAGISSLDDTLLRKVFARVGFLLARLWKNFPEETQDFWMENAEVGSLIMKETMQRREQEAKNDLPAMDCPVSRPPPQVREPRVEW